MAYDDGAQSRRQLLRQMNEREDNLFHLQQELLRQGGQQVPRGQFGEMQMRTQPSTGTEADLQRDDSTTMQRRRLEALRDSLRGDAPSQMGQGGATMDVSGSAGMGAAGSFAFHPTTAAEAGAQSPQLSLKRAAMAAPQRHDGLSKSVGATPAGRYFDASFGGQDAMAPMGADRGSFQMPDAQSYPDMNDYAGIDGSSQGAVARKSYHDEPNNFQSLSNQYDYGPMASPPPMNNSTTAPQNVGWEASNRLLARAWTSFRDEQSDRVNTNQSGQLGQGSHHSLPSSINHQPSRAFEISSQAGPTQRQATQGMPRSSSPYTSWLQESSSRTIDVQQGSLGPPNNQPPLVDAASGSIKRRRLDSGESLLLEMLTDTIVSPHATKAIYGQPQPAHQAVANAPHSDSAIMRAALAGSGGLSSSMSPYASYAKPSVAMPHGKSMSLTPNQQVAGMAPMDTPKMFADFMLGGGGVDVSGMPPPPFVSNNVVETHTKSNERPDLGFQGAAAHQGLASGDVIVLTEDPPVSSRSTALGPLPLPPRKGGHGKKRSKGSKGPKKGKDGTGTAADTSNHIITPSTSTIAALTQEIRSRVRSSSKDERASNDAAPHNAISDFASAIEASQSSQQAIHDWDRKFGLRRAHSKTMRESCRSRKKVLDFLKGEGAGLFLRVESKGRTDDSQASAAAVSQDEKMDVAEEPSESAGDSKRTEHTKADDELADAPRAHEETKASSQRWGTPYASDEDVAKTSPSKVDDQLTQLFRRASLECAKPVLPADILAVARPPPLHDADRRQYHANSA